MQLAQKTFSEQVKGILKQLLAGQRPGIQDLAKELHLSTRTFQRRLTEQTLRFSDYWTRRVVNWPIIIFSIHLGS